MQSFSAAVRTGFGVLAKLANGIRPTTDLSKRGADLSRGPLASSKLPAAAWSNTWPAPAATLDLDFANNRGFVRGSGQGGAMDAVTFTRASSGNWVDNTGVLRTGAGTFTGTANALGLNILSNPQNFDNAAWVKGGLLAFGSGSSVNALTAPDGTQTAQSLIENTSAGLHYTAQAISSTSGTTYTSSFYVKSNGRSKVRLSLQLTSEVFAVRFDLSALTATTTAGSGTASITDAGNGWCRIVATATATSTGSPGYVELDLVNAANATSYTGDGTSGIYIWGAQLEVGSSATTYYPTNINAPRFDWASTALLNGNLIPYSQNFTNAAWTKFGPPTLTADYATDPDGTNTATRFQTTGLQSVYQNVTLAVGTTYTFSIYAKSTTSGVNNNFRLQFGPGATDSLAVTTTDTWQVYTRTITYSSGSFAVGIVSPASGSADVLIWGAQLEIGAANTTYKQTGAQVATNTPLVANSTCNGLLIEESRTNRILWCRDGTQSNWTKTNVTAAKNQTGIDGIANAATSLTASANNGTCIQTITLASGSRTGSVYLKRITGTGNVQVTLDGSTWSTVDLSNGLWNRIVLSGTVTNPCVGVLLATNGDAVAMDYAQVEDGAFVTSPILTTTATATRAIDSTTISGQIFNVFYNQGKGTFICNVNITGISLEVYPWALGTGVTRQLDYRTLNAINFYSSMGANQPIQSGLGIKNLNRTAFSMSPNGMYQNCVNGGSVGMSQYTFPYQRDGYNSLLIMNTPTGYLNRLTYYPNYFSAPALQDLSGQAT